MASEPKAKVCKNCLELKPYSDFYKNLRMKDGHWSICKACESDRGKAYYKANRGEVLERTSEYRRGNPEISRAAGKRYYHRNRKKSIQRKLDWYKSNPDKAAASSSMYRARTKGATPIWLSPEQRGQIQSFYEHARDCRAVSGQEYHVDHIIPLQGKNVCGLHVPWNLQVLPSDINIAKSNSNAY